MDKLKAEFLNDLLEEYEVEFVGCLSKEITDLFNESKKILKPEGLTYKDLKVLLDAHLTEVHTVDLEEFYSMWVEGPDGQPIPYGPYAV